MGRHVVFQETPASLSQLKRRPRGRRTGFLGPALGGGSWPGGHSPAAPMLLGPDLSHGHLQPWPLPGGCARVAVSERSPVVVFPGLWASLERPSLLVSHHRDPE